MEFDKSKVYTALNADELKIGSKCIFANNLDSLKCKVEEGTDIRPIVQILNDSYERRFKTNVRGEYPFAYLISEPEEKKLKWTDLKLGDVIHEKDGTETRMITGIDTRDEVDDDCNISHICASGWWCTDEILKNWEKVE